MSSFSSLFKKEMVEILRTKKLLILAILFAFVAISSPAMAKLIPELLKNMDTGGIMFKIPTPSWKDAIDQYVKNINQIVAIVMVFMLAGAIAEEKNKKTLEIVLTKPVARSKFVLAKFFSNIAYITAALASCSLIFYFYTTVLFGSFSLYHFVWLNIFILVYLILVVALTIFASTLVTNQIMAAAIAFVNEIAIFSILGLWKKIELYLPGYTLGHYKELMADGKISDFLPSIWITLGLTMVLICGAIIIFQNQEIER